MGFATIIGQIMLIMTVILIVSSFLIQQKLNVEELDKANSIKDLISKNKVQSSIEITNYTVVGSTYKNLSLIVKNTGSLKLKDELFDVYLNNTLLNKNNYTTKIITDVINLNILDPEERLEIIFTNISYGYNYITLVTEYSSKANKLIEVS